ncbi:hypothetical protein ABZ635_15840 [Nocardiopsis sp. NPDC007018]|uniref:hypothetical protein n=1 Tax=Nocardiopsis sp. NPDC007018 TaxID=3155721 RepID=UPI0033FFD12D
MTAQETERPHRAGASVTGDHASAHTGSGDLNRNSTINRAAGDFHQSHHHYYAAYGDRLEADAQGRVKYVKERRIVAGDRLSTLRGRFVAPVGFDEHRCRADIATHGAVVLSAVPGSGARTAALMVLAPKGTEADQDVEEDLVRVGPNGRPELVGGEELGGGERLLVNLMRESGFSPASLRDALEDLRQRSQRARARLVVLVERGDEGKLPESLRDLVVPLGRPDPLAVLGRHLESREVPGHAAVDGLAEAGAWAESASMSAIEETARRTSVVCRESEYRGNIGDWLGAALDSGESVPTEDLEEVKGRARAILLAASLMEGAPVEHLAVGVDALLSQVSFPEDETPLLDRPGFQEELRERGIETRHDRRVYFTRAGRGRALRAAFWDAHPRLHASFGAWVDTLMADAVLGPADRDRVAQRWAEQALRVADPTAVFGRARSWSEQRRRTAPQAALLITSVLMHERYGSHGRRFLYEETGSTALSPGWGQVLVAVCAQEVAATHPEQAMVRLHRLALNREDAVADAARAELNTLALKSALHAKLLRRVCERLRRHEHRSARELDAERDLLWDLTDPRQLAGVLGSHHDGTDARRWIVEGLATVFHRERDRTREYAIRWIGHGDQLMDVLVRAASAAGALPQLYTSALRWSAATAAPASRERCRADGALLIRSVDAEQGLGEGLSPHAAYATEGSDGARAPWEENT